MGIFDRGDSNDELLIVTEIVNNSEGNSVTKKNITGRKIGGESALSYIQDGEQPHYILHNRSKGLTYNKRGQKNTIQPSASSCALGIFTDQRILFLVGSDSGVDQHRIGYDEIKGVEASTGVLKNRMVIKTLYANYQFYVSGSVSPDEFENAVRFIRQQARLEKPEITDGEPVRTTEYSISDDGQDKQRVLQQLRETDPYDFEYFVADLWEAQGWDTTVSQASVDQGVDIIATKENPFPQKQVIQAKRYAKNNTIGSPKVQQYSSLRQQEEGADVSIVVTTSGFSHQAEKLAENLNVKLVDAEGIYRLLRETGRFDLVSNYAPIPVESAAESTGTQEQQMVQEESDTGGNEFDAEVSPVNDSESKDNSFLKEYKECPSCGNFVAMKRTWRRDLIFPILQCTQCQTMHHENDDELVPLPKYRSERDENASKYGYYGVASAIALAILGVGVPALAFISWVILTIAISRDTRYVRSNSNGNPSTGYWVWGTVLLPFISIGILGGIGAGLSLLIIGGIYLIQRYRNDHTESDIHQGGIRTFIAERRG